MGNFIPLEIDGTENQVYLEVIPTGNQTGIQQRSKDRVADKLTADEFKQMIRQAVMPACQTFVDVWQELNQPMTAESAEVEFNLGFTASGSAVIMQASGQASFKVKVSWKFQPLSNTESLRAKILENLKKDLELLEFKANEAIKIYKESPIESHQEKTSLLQELQKDSNQIRAYCQNK
ncbi:MAG TPA: hypothetical protein DCE56_11000 [Cyanobacteria bacterium UBA8553]|nr:hypothetical protein [Cyanobacteria bacterium UBA8553]HAJ62588.1 hypothetical protein [Cyanobacteria bacterium UBA8543]